jgi:hypothetical protein
MVSHYLLGNGRTVRDGFNFGLELWHTCAGPLGCLPTLSSLVLYWPQGHLEHVSCHSTLFKNIMAFWSIKKNSSVCSVQVVNFTLQASVQPPMLDYDLPPHICVSLQITLLVRTQVSQSTIVSTVGVWKLKEFLTCVSSERCILPLTVYAQMDITPVREVCSHIVLSCNNLHTITSPLPKTNIVMLCTQCFVFVS